MMQFWPDRSTYVGREDHTFFFTGDAINDVVQHKLVSSFGPGGKEMAVVVESVVVFLPGL